LTKIAYCLIKLQGKDIGWICEFAGTTEVIVHLSWLLKLLDIDYVANKSLITQAIAAVYTFPVRVSDGF